MRKLTRRFLALHPLLQNAVITVALLAVYWIVVLTTDFSDDWSWWMSLGIGWTVGWIIGRIGRYVGEVAQARRDLADDEVAMHDAIARFERGDG